MNYEAFWYKLGSDGQTSLNTLLGLSYDAYSEIMIELNLFKKQQTKQTYPKKTY